jgi:hypothetical protein
MEENKVNEEERYVMARTYTGGHRIYWLPGMKRTIYDENYILFSECFSYYSYPYTLYPFTEKKLEGSTVMLTLHRSFKPFDLTYGFNLVSEIHYYNCSCTPCNKCSKLLEEKFAPYWDVTLTWKSKYLSGLELVERETQPP